MIATSAACVLIGAVAMGIQIEGYEEVLGPDLSEAANSWLAAELIVGFPIACAIGPLRRAQGYWNWPIIATIGWSNMAVAAAVVALARIGRRRELGTDLLALALVGASMTSAELLRQLVVLDNGGKDLPLLPLMIALAALPLLWGRMRSTRAALVESLQVQAATAEQARAATERGLHDELARVREDERRAIARDMHDSISHHLSIIAMHAGALAHRSDLPAEESRQAMRVVRDSAAAANTDLRSALLALRTPGSAADTTPLLREEWLADLLAESESHDQSVRLEWDGLDETDLHGGSVALVTSLRRIVSELLVNARKHAPGCPVQLTLRRRGDDVEVHAVNGLPDHGREPADPRGPLSTGHGLVGVAERAEMLGGRSWHGITTSAAGVPTYEVSVVVPWL